MTSDQPTTPPDDGSHAPAFPDQSVFDVRAFGAVGDGTTDDTDAIERAVAAAGHHGIVLFGRGRFRTTRTISLPTDQTWRGLGINDTGTHQREPEHAILTDVPDGPAVVATYNTTLERLMLRGRGTGTGIQASGRVRLDEVDLQRYDVAVSADELWYGHFSGLRLLANGTGLRLNHSYNLTIVEPRFHCVLPDGRPGVGIELASDVDLKVFGGSIEGYRQGIRSQGHNSVHVYSTYFESSPRRLDYGQRPGAVAFDLTDDRRTTLGVVGCYVYLHHTDAFVDLTGARDVSVVASTNHFRGGVRPPEPPEPVAYRWGQDDHPRVQLTGDLWDVDFPEHAWYLEPDAPLMAAGIVAPPPDSMRGRLPDGQVFTGSDMVLTRGQLGLAVTEGVPAIRPSEAERRRGSVVFHAPSGLPIVFNGHAWTQFDGTPVGLTAGDRLDALGAAARDVPLGPVPLLARRLRRFAGRQVRRLRRR